MHQIAVAVGMAEFDHLGNGWQSSLRAIRLDGSSVSASSEGR
jgi:hypothetical protein